MEDLIVEILLSVFVAFQAYRNHKAHSRHRDRHEELRRELTNLRSGPSSDSNESPLSNQGRPEGAHIPRALPSPGVFRGSK